MDLYWYRIPFVQMRVRSMKVLQKVGFDPMHTHVYGEKTRHTQREGERERETRDHQ
jgi:hypothetical protein